MTSRTLGAAGLLLCAALGVANAASELAFVSLRGGEAQVYVRQADGRIQSVTSGSDFSVQPAWSSRGSFAFARKSGGATRVYIQDGLQGAARAVSEAEGWMEHGPTWSPDGSTLAYFAQPLTGGAPELRLFDVDSGRTVTLFKATQGLGPAPVSWSSNGQRLVVIAAAEEPTPHLWLLTRDGSAPPVNISAALVPRGAHAAQIDPEGRKVAWTAALATRAPLMLTDLETLETRDITPRGVSLTDAPRWSPDGRQLAFVARVPFADRDNSDILVIPVHGPKVAGAPLNLSSHEAEDFDPRWSGDGRSVVFASLRTGTSLLFEVDATGGVTRPVSVHPSHDMAHAMRPLQFSHAAPSNARGESSKP